MHARKRMIIYAILGVSLLVLLLAGTVWAQSAGLNLPWWTADGGGGEAGAPGVHLRGSIGQPDAGALSGPGYQLSGGFWAGGPPAAQPRAVYLPLIGR